MTTSAPSAPGDGAAGHDAAAPDGRWPRSHTITLFAFLGVFALLIFAFREVLFPFLMAFYLAYLVEPVIEFATREKTFGVRWGRGPTIILLYTVVLVGAFFLVSCGVQKIGNSISTASSDFTQELKKTAPSARLSLKGEKGEALGVVWLPADFALEDAKGVLWKTLFPEPIGEGKPGRVLLKPTTKSPSDSPVFPAMGTTLTVVETKGLSLPEGVTLSAVADREETGLKLMVAKYVVAPSARWLEKTSGTHFDPGHIRYFIDDQTEKQTAQLGERAFEWSRKIPFTVGGPIYQMILVLMLTAFIVVDRRGIARFFASIPSPHVRPQYEKLMRYVDRGLAGVIRGQLLICVVNGLLTWFGLWILDVPYSAMLALLAGIFSLIPVFGTIASSIPIVLVALAMKGFETGLFALAWIFLIHLMEANIFNPLIMGTSAEMHPVIIIFALLAGESAFGVWGALLAVPTASLFQAGFKYFRHEILKIPVDEAHRHGQWMRNWMAKWKSKKAAQAATPGGAP